MIEEIKKDIYNKNMEDERKFYITISKKTLDEILDKHNNEINYKMILKELKKNIKKEMKQLKSLEIGFDAYDELMINSQISILREVFDNIKTLEQKYNLGGE